MMKEYPRQHISESMRIAARSLAVAYSAFEQARREFYTAPDDSNANSVIVWAYSLRQAQTTLDIELVNPDVLDRYIKRADKYCP
jgi:hypothetical protein